MSYPTSSARGRGRGRGYFKSPTTSAPSAPVYDLTEGIEDIIKSFDRNASAPIAPVRITDVRPIASYSWLNTGGKEPTVRVPGTNRLGSLSQCLASKTKSRVSACLEQQQPYAGPSGSRHDLRRPKRGEDGLQGFPTQPALRRSEGHEQDRRNR